MKGHEGHIEKNIVLVDTSDIISLLQKYNDQFSMGRTMGRALIEGMSKDLKPEDPDSLDIQATEEFLTFDDMKREAVPLLAATGLGLQSVKTGWAVDKHGLSEMRLNIEDGEKFVMYLKALSPDSITVSQKTGLRLVADVLIRQLRTEYNLNNPEDERVYELLGNLSVILSEYRRLSNGSDSDFIKSISSLEKYSSYAKAATLREFIAVEKLNLDKPFTGKGFTLRWHTDATPKYLKKHWDYVVATLQKISKNEKAGEIYAQAVSTTNEALDAAIKEVLEWPDVEKGYKAYKKQFLSILESTKGQLKEF